MQWPRGAPLDLADRLACTWTAEMSETELLLPDGCVDIVCLDPDDVWVCGPERHAWRSPVPAATTAFGVRIRPGQVGPLLGTEAGELADARVPIDAVLATPRARRLRDRLADSSDPPGELLAEVRRWRDDAAAGSSLDHRLVAAATSVDPPTVGALAADLGISRRHVHRRSRRLFGYGYSVLVRFLRLQRFLQLVRTRPGTGLAPAAAASGYVDQAHLGRECRSITGLAPTALLAETTRTFPETMSDPYKTPAPASAPMAS